VIRVLADANVLVSAALSRDPRAPSVLVLDAALDGRIELITSPTLLGELASVLARPRLRRYLSIDDAERFVADLAGVTALMEDPPAPHHAVCRDPADDYLVALAHSANADAVVTGDLDLLSLAEPGLSVITPRTLIERLASDDQPTRTVPR
jgi:putative PIN family toxin of toxin-antitoxin system